MLTHTPHGKFLTQDSENLDSLVRKTRLTWPKQTLQKVANNCCHLPGSKYRRSKVIIWQKDFQRGMTANLRAQIKALNSKKTNSCSLQWNTNGENKSRRRSSCFQSVHRKPMHKNTRKCEQVMTTTHCQSWIKHNNAQKEWEILLTKKKLRPNRYHLGICRMKSAQWALKLQWSEADIKNNHHQNQTVFHQGHPLSSFNLVFRCCKRCLPLPSARLTWSAHTAVWNGIGTAGCSPGLFEKGQHKVILIPTAQSSCVFFLQW